MIILIYQLNIKNLSLYINYLFRHLIYLKILKTYKRSSNMMLIVILILLAFIGYFSSTFYFIPLFRIKKLTKQFEQKGYKVKNLGFSFLGYSLGDMMKKNHMRFQFLKYNFTEYDVAIGNILSTVSIIPISLDLVKDCFIKTKQIAKSQFDVEMYCYFNDGGVVFSEGQKYKRKKKIISSVFHFDFLMSLTPYITETVDYKLKQIEENVKNRIPIQSRVFFGQILSEVISKYFLGVSMSHVQIGDKKLPQYIQDFTDQFNQYIYSSEHVLLGHKGLDYNISKTARKLKQSYKAIGAQIEKIVKQKLQEFKAHKIENKDSKTQHKNLLYSFIQNNMLGQVASENKYSFQEIVGQFFVFYVGGVDTTSALLTVLMFVLAKNPSILESMRKQCDQLDEKQLSTQNLKKMTYTEGVINQGLRMYGPAALSFIRQVKSKQFTIGANQVRIPQNYSINYVNMIHHFDQKYFKNPHQFRPQRWQEQVRNLESFVFIPFGAGQRSCLGQHLAKLQMKAVLLKIVKNYDIVAEQQLDMKFGFVYRNNTEQIILVKRNKSI